MNFSFRLFEIEKKRTTMTRPKGQKRFAEMKRMIKLTDARLKAKDRVKPRNHDKKEEKKKIGEITEKQVAPVASALFFRYNTQLGNFLTFSSRLIN